MSGFVLKSFLFRREREASWRELETLVAQAERGRGRALPPSDLMRLPALYRAALSSLSVARAISLDRNLVLYLESLAARAYFYVYGTRRGVLASLATFFLHSFPAAVRAARWHVLISALFTALGAVAGFTLTLENEDWYYAFVSEGLAGSRSPTSSTEELRAVLYDDSDSLPDTLYLFATFLFTHNAKIGLLCFSLGFAFGVPVVLLLFYNGLMIGAFAALYEARGLSADLWGWLGVHGTTELLAVILCGGAGLVLSSSLAFPGRYGRMDSLVQGGRLASRIVIGAVAMFFVAGLLEGVVRQLVTDISVRYLIAVAALAWWCVYFIGVGRGRRDEAE